MILDSGDLLFKKYKNPISENEKHVEIEKADLMVKSFNLMGLDVLSIGDDDLSLGKGFLLEISKKTNFPIIASNIFDEETDKPIFMPYLLKEINGIKIGIFGLISEHLFSSPDNSRKKGIKIVPPLEIATKIVEELRPKTDLIILLSHLSYPKDIELIQTVKGINFIFGSHLGMNLSSPPIINNTVILQSAPKGMYGAMVDLTIYNNQPVFYNLSTKREMERRLHLIQQRLNQTQIREEEKTQLIKAKNEYDKTLRGFSGKNEFAVFITTLHDQIKEDPEIKKLIEDYKAKISIHKGTNPQKN